jgi:hypothetical protein
MKRTLVLALWPILLAAASAVAILIGPPAAKADPPSPSEADTAAARALLKDNWDWVRTRPDDPDSFHAVEIRIATVESARHWVGYTTAKLRPEVNHEGPRGEHHRDRTLVGFGTQYFSDRRWQSPSSPEQNPFDPSKQDRVRIAIDVESATLTMTLKTWGDAEFVVPLFASNGLLYGYSGPAMLVIDFKQVTAAR